MRGRGGGDLHTLVGAYAMDAVTPADRARFEQHLAGCDPCRAEVRGLREATARLAAAAQVRPRPELREQTMQAASLIRQLPPEGDPQAPVLVRWRARRRVVLSWAAGGLAVGLAAAAIAAGLAMSGAEHRLDMAQRRTHAIAAVLGAPDATMLTAKVTTGGSATVVMSHRDRALVFTAAGLPVLAPGQSYELWLMAPGGAVSEGMLPDAKGGMRGPMVISGLAPGDRVGLTVEPASGATRPTTPSILMLSP
jgi:anti-sigma factor RsiW